MVKNSEKNLVSMEKKAITVLWNNVPIACEKEMLDHNVLQGIPEVPECETTDDNYNKSKIMSKPVVEQNFKRDQRYKCNNEAQRVLTKSNSHMRHTHSHVAPSLTKNMATIHSPRLRAVQDHSDIPYTAVILKRSIINPKCCDKIVSQKFMNRKSFFDRQSRIKDENRRLTRKTKKANVEITTDMGDEKLAKKKTYKRSKSKSPNASGPSENVCCNRSNKLTKRLNNTNVKNIRKITNWRSEVLKIFSKLTVLLLYLHFLLSYNLTLSKSQGLREVFGSCMIGDIRQ